MKTILDNLFISRIAYKADDQVFLFGIQISMDPFLFWDMYEIY